jgi:2-dehydro-3-deoxyphosphooctonate aldolase (KDO 8-P synthase)
MKPEGRPVREVRRVRVSDRVEVGGGLPLLVVAGPCVVEDPARTLAIARRARDMAGEAGLPFVFKASYDKANRTSLHSFRGPGVEEALQILAGIREEQTDFVMAVARAGRTVNVKKGQFLSPWDLAPIAEKITSTGNQELILTERGACFGYQNLVVDMRSLPTMRATGFPVLFDATHSVQLPGAHGDSTGGMREYIPYLARAAVAAGCDGVFMEVHDRPEEGLSDRATMFPLDQLPRLLGDLAALDRMGRERGFRGMVEEAQPGEVG